MLLLSLQEHPNWAPCLRFLASCYAHLGRLGDAQSIVEKLKSITPDLVPSAEHRRIRRGLTPHFDRTPYRSSAARTLRNAMISHALLQIGNKRQRRWVGCGKESSNGGPFHRALFVNIVQFQDGVVARVVSRPARTQIGRSVSR
jgi:hypothetical protein